MIASVQRIVRAADCLIARAYLGLFREGGGGLLAFLFHSLFRDEGEIALNQVDPLQRTTVSQFRAFVEYYLNHGFRFIGPDDLRNGMRPDGKYALISFDPPALQHVPEWLFEAAARPRRPVDFEAVGCSLPGTGEPGTRSVQFVPNPGITSPRPPLASTY